VLKVVKRRLPTILTVAVVRVGDLHGFLLAVVTMRRWGWVKRERRQSLVGGRLLSSWRFMVFTADGAETPDVDSVSVTSRL